MSKEPETGGGFELEPEEDRPRPKPPITDPPPAPAAHVELPSHEGEPEPDARTLAERKGSAVPTTPDALPPPPNWPGEVFSFPLRKPGRSFFVGVGGAFVLADYLSAAGPLLFVSYVLWVVIWVCALRAQAAVVGQSAAGKDGPVGWQSAMELDFTGLSATARFVVFYVLGWILPFWLARLFGLDGAVWVAVVLSPYLAVLMLGWATGDRTLKWPWKALAWIARRPLEFLVGALGWWALWYGQQLIMFQPLPLLLVLSPIIRFASLYVLLVSARAIGVAGRSWTPWGYQDPA